MTGTATIVLPISEAEAWRRRLLARDPAAAFGVLWTVVWVVSEVATGRCVVELQQVVDADLGRPLEAAR